MFMKNRFVNVVTSLETAAMGLKIQNLYIQIKKKQYLFKVDLKINLYLF